MTATLSLISPNVNRECIFFGIIYRFSYVPKCRRKEEKDNVHNTKRLFVNRFDVNAISTKEKQQKVFESLAIFYDSLIFSNIIQYFFIFAFRYFYFYCSYVNTCLFTFYSIVSEIVYTRSRFIHELELENDRGKVETSFLFLSLVFATKCLTKIFLLRINVLIS